MATTPTTDSVRAALAAAGDELAAERPGTDPVDALVDHVAQRARRLVAATGCSFADACELVIDLLLAEHGHRQDEKPQPTELHWTRPAWADRADATGRVVWTADDGWLDQ